MDSGETMTDPVRAIPTLVIHSAPECRDWPFYGRAVAEIGRGDYAAPWVKDDEAAAAERRRRIEAAIAERRRYLAQHERAAGLLRADLAALEAAIAPDDEAEAEAEAAPGSHDAPAGLMAAAGVAPSGIVYRPYEDVRFGG